MSVKKVAVFQNNTWHQEPFAVDLENVSISNATQENIGDIIYVGEDVNNPSLTYSPQVKLDNLTGLTGNIQNQLNEIYNALGLQQNILSLEGQDKYGISFDFEQEKTITITQTGNATNFTVKCSNPAFVITPTSDFNKFKITCSKPYEIGFISILSSLTPSYKKAIFSIMIQTSMYVSTTLNDNSWEVISYISNQGGARNWWSVGDRKTITLNGNITEYQQQSFQNYETNVFILGFNHNSTIEGTGINFGCFKRPYTNTIQILSEYNQGLRTTEQDFPFPLRQGKTFSMNHYSTAFGVNYSNGWKSCDLRYDVLGSTDIPPDNWKELKTQSSLGYDASSTCAINPPNSTLMSLFPESLRKIMKPMTKYSYCIDQFGNLKYLPSVDYLPLISKTELGCLTENAYEETYDYFKQGVNIKKTMLNSCFNKSDNKAVFWVRDTESEYPLIVPTMNYFEELENQITDIIEPVSAHFSYGLFPVFLV